MLFGLNVGLAVECAIDPGSVPDDLPARLLLAGKPDR